MLNREKVEIKFGDILLIIGIVFSSMTELRIMKIGPAELLIFLWSLFVLIRYKFNIKIDFFISIILLFDFLLIIGLAYRSFFNVNSGSFASEMITYVYFTIFIIGLVQYLKNTEKEKLKYILAVIFWVSGIVYGLLYFYAKFFSATMFGISLWFGGGTRLSLLSNNPHHLNYIIGPIILIGAYLIFSYFRHLKHKVFAGVIILLFIQMGLETQAATFEYTLFINAIILIVFGIKLSRNRKKNILIKLSVILFLLSFILVSYQFIVDSIISFIQSDASGEGRLELWGMGIKISLDNYLVGLGPGPHIPWLGTFYEAHSNFVDILLRMGIVGLIVYLSLFIYSLLFTRNNIHAFNLVLFFFLYGISGYSIRRIAFWFFIIIIVYIIRKDDDVDFKV